MSKEVSDCMHNEPRRDGKDIWLLHPEVLDGVGTEAFHMTFESMRIHITSLIRCAQNTDVEHNNSC